MNEQESKGKTLLYKAAEAGDVTKCEELLSRGANTEIANENGWTPLFIAARRGHIDVCEVLLKAGAAVDHDDKNGYTPLSRAASNGHDKVCEVLLKAGAAVDNVNNDGYTSLSLAARWGHDKVCELLLKAGGAVDHVNNDGDTPLSRAARLYKYIVCQLLITKYGADCKHSRVSKYLDKMLVWAAEQEDMKMIASLIDAGADINYKNSNGQTPVQLILASNKTDDPVYKMVSLYNAAREGNHKLCEDLLENHADPNLTDKEGRTPLYFACSDGDKSLVEKLISKGADVNSVGCLQTALDLYYNDVAQILIENGCDVNKVKYLCLQKTLTKDLLKYDFLRCSRTEVP